MRKLVIIVVSLCFISSVFGCASRNVVQQPSLSVDLSSQQNKVVENGIKLLVKPIHSISDMKIYYDDDVLRYGVLPIQLYMQNMSKNNYLIVSDGINLIDPTGHRMPALSLEQAYERLKKSYLRSGGWAVAFGVFAAFSVHNVYKVNKKMKADLYSRMFKGGNFSSGNMVEGTLFFDVSPNLTSINGWKLSVVMRNGLNDEVSIVEYNLAGNIEKRQLPQETSGDNMVE